MKSYQAATPRTAILIAAAAMTALMLNLSILPAKVGGSAGSLTNAASTFGPATRALGEGKPIMVYGVREQETAMQKVQVPHVVPPQKQQS